MDSDTAPLSEWIMPTLPALRERKDCMADMQGMHGEYA